MSLRPVTSEDIQGLVRAIEALNLCVGLLVERFEAVSQSEAEWEVIESEIPGGYPKAKDLQKTHWGGVEDPRDVPSFAFSLGKRLTGADVGAETPVRRAFVAGFHAKIAIDIHTPTTRRSLRWPWGTLSGWWFVDRLLEDQFKFLQREILDWPLRVPRTRSIRASLPLRRPSSFALVVYPTPLDPLQRWGNHQ